VRQEAGALAGWGRGPRMVARLRRAALGLRGPRTGWGPPIGEVCGDRCSSALVVAEADEFTRVFFAGQLTADGYEVLSALESSRVGSRAAGGAVDLLLDAVPTRLGQVA